MMIDWALRLEGDVKMFGRLGKIRGRWGLGIRRMNRQFEMIVIWMNSVLCLG